VRQHDDGPILGPSPQRFAVAALHPEQSAAADLFEHAP